MSSLSRRAFLGKTSCAAVSSIPVLNTLLNLRLFSSIASASVPANGEYRALVCLFQSGGHDSYNLLVPYSGASGTNANAYQEYLNSRSDLGLEQQDLIEVNPNNTPGRTFGVHGSMPNLAARFQAGKAAFIANVGTLVEPVMNRTQVFNASKLLPLGLYSHSDQIEQWQTSVPHSRSGLGWAGKMMDLIKNVNTSQVVPMNISMDGSNVWQTGVTGAEYAVSAGNSQEPEGGAIGLDGYSPTNIPGQPIINTMSAAVDSQLAQTYANLLQETFQQKRRAAQDAYEVYSAATAGTLPGNITFPNTALGRQLRQVAKAIMGRNGLGAVRQSFFVNRGGWDHHSDTLELQAAMLEEVDEAVEAFYLQLEQLGIADKVTLFSSSDFGRTLTSNGRGSDHAWGGNHFVVGDSVVGKNIYGSFPSLAVNPDAGMEINPLDTGRGRLIPTTSCDQYFAELALWVGVPASSLQLILPNIGNFYATNSGTPPLGFLGAL